MDSQGFHGGRTPLPSALSAQAPAGTGHSRTALEVSKTPCSLVLRGDNLLCDALSPVQR